jgi:hypothetical protein
MYYSISPDKKTLTLLAVKADRENLEEWKEEGFNDKTESEALEPIIANSDLEWIRPEENGDLTDAPILGYRDENGESTGERWAFMDYQVRSFLQDLMDKGVAIFTAP